ncbi:MAG: glycosyltransferase [Polyangiaceae bacterium]
MSDRPIVIASTTLTGNNADIIADAIKSVVDWVDICLVIDTGVSDDSLRIAREIAGDKYRERSFPWRNDFAAARNFALDAAHEAGADWAVTLDTDERIHSDGEDLRAIMQSASEGCLMMSHAARTYAKARCVRLPCPERYSGPTHEALPGYKLGQRTLARSFFSELGKTPAQLERKFQRDVEILLAHLAEHPQDARWHYYLGDSLRNLGKYPEAIQAYDACAELRGWNEESAWACYQAADCLSRLGRFREVIDRCARGLTRHAGIAELCWLAGFAAFKLNDNPQAVYWSRMAIAQGLFKGAGAKVPRIGFRNPNALYEGPYDVLRFALRNMGDSAGAAEAERLYHEAIKARTTPQPAKPQSDANATSNAAE